MTEEERAPLWRVCWWIARDWVATQLMMLALSIATPKYVRDLRQGFAHDYLRSIRR